MTRNYKLFVNHTDTELSKKWGLSSERVRQLRIEKGYDHISSKKMASDRRYKVLITYLRKNQNKSFSIKQMQDNIGLFNLYGKSVNIKYIKSICKKANIKLSLPTKKLEEHGYERYRRKLCKCQICRLANNLKSRYLYQGHPIGACKATELAQKYYKTYINDKSIKKEKFYIKINQILGI